MNYLSKYESLINSPLFDIGPIVIFIWENTDGWPVKAVSKNIQTIYGHNVDDYLDGTLVYANQIHKDDIELVTKEVIEASSSSDESFIHKPYRILDFKNEYRWVDDTTMLIRDENGVVTHYVGYIKDITKQIESLHIETMLKEAQKMARIGSWKLDNRSNNLMLSDEAYRVFGIDKIKYPVLASEAFFNIVHPDDIEQLNKVFTKHLETQEPYILKNRLITSDNIVKYIEGRCETTFDEAGKPLISTGTVQDITEKTLREIQLVQKEKLLVQQSRLAQMGEMISMIAHQWRQPLSTISMTADNIKMQSLLNKFDLSKEKEAKEYELLVNGYANKINDYVQNLSTTIDDFRNFFKQNKDKVTVKLDTVIVKSLAIINAQLVVQGIEIVEEYNSKESIELFDNEMVHVILNILKNAQDNFKEKQIENAYIKITTQNRTISISDNGGGIPEDIREQIFYPYFSTKNEKNGTGLGLYMSQTIVENHHNGKLSVKNTDDGVCFSIELGRI